MIKVKRHRDGKVFTSDMSAKESIDEINFHKEYTQVLAYELKDDGKVGYSEIFCKPDGTSPEWYITELQGVEDTGEFI